MPRSEKHVCGNSPSRRDFLKTSSLVAGGTLVGGLSLGRSAHAAGSDVLRIGLIGWRRTWQRRRR